MSVGAQRCPIIAKTHGLSLPANLLNSYEAVTNATLGSMFMNLSTVVIPLCATWPVTSVENLDTAEDNSTVDRPLSADGEFERALIETTTTQ